jgi:hypothetical protein
MPSVCVDGFMWRSGKTPPKVRTSKLPPSEKVLLWAKDDRYRGRTQFHEWEREWDSTTRRKAVAPSEIPETPKKGNAALPAWMNYRSQPTKQAPLYFRTKPGGSTKKP